MSPTQEHDAALCKRFCLYQLLHLPPWPLFRQGTLLLSSSGIQFDSFSQVPSMCYEGLFWFKDLTVADPFYVMPVVNSAIFLLTIELNAADGMQGYPPAMLEKMKMFMRILAVVFVPLTASFPSSMFCYWITSSCFSLVQSQLIKDNRVRRLLRLPPAVKRKTDLFKSPMVISQSNASSRMWSLV